MMRSLRATMCITSWPGARPIFLMRRGGGESGARRMILCSVLRQRRRQDGGGRVADTRVGGVGETSLLRALEFFSAFLASEGP